MKRLISALVLVAMMLASFTTVISVFADVIPSGNMQPVKTFNVNWKELVDGGVMRAQWLYDRKPSNNNMEKYYEIIPTENSLSLQPIGKGDHRQYYSDVMFDITADTQYVYELEVKSCSYDGDGGFIFAFANNPYARDELDSKTDIFGNDVDDMVATYFLNGKLNDGKTELCFGGAWLNYGYEDSKVLEQDIVNAKISEDGYTKYRIIYTGLHVEIFYQNNRDEWVELFTYENIKLAEGAKLAFGVYTWPPDWADIRNCVVYAMNDVSAKIIETAYINSWIARADEMLLNGPSYTILSKAALEDALAKAKAVAANQNATQEEIDEAATTLAQKIVAIKIAANKAKLQLAIDVANETVAGYTAVDFEERYWTPFKDAFDFAVALNNDTEAEQGDVDYATTVLNDTVKYLTPAGEACLVDLDAALTRYYNLVETDYTPNSWETLADPYAKAEALGTRPNLTNANQNDIDAAAANLENAIHSLVKRADFGDLKAVFERALALDMNDYKPESIVDNFEQLLIDAENVLADYNSSQETVDEARDRLIAAINMLVTVKTNVLAIVPPDDYVCNSNQYGDSPTWYNKITDMSYFGLGNVFYYDYYKVVANKTDDWPYRGFEAGKAFPDSLYDLSIQGDANYVLRLGTNISGSGHNRVCDGEKEYDVNAAEHRANPTIINGKTYGHVFGFSFLKAPTVDSVAFYLPVNTKIVSIDIYGAVRETLADGTVLYGKADRSDVENTDGVWCEDSTTVKKVYLGTVNVPVAVSGANIVYAMGDFIQAMKVDYIYFALTFEEGTSKNTYYRIVEAELFGLNEGVAVNGKTAADFTEINSAYKKFMSCVKEDYTENSWNAVLTAFERYKNVISNCLSAQDQVDAAADAIWAALDGLAANTADLSALNNAINLGLSFKESDYTPNSFIPFVQMLENAISVKNTSNVSQSEVDNVLADLNAAIDSLVKRADKTILARNLQIAKGYKMEDWNGNKISWKMFENAVAKAEALMADDNATQINVDVAAEQIVARVCDLSPTEKEDDDIVSDESAITAKRTEMLLSLGEKKVNSLNMYTQSSYNKYVHAYDAIVIAINSAKTLEELNAINVEQEKSYAESLLEISAQDLTALKNEALKVLGEKIENIANKFTSTSYSDYIFAYYSIVSHINNAKDIDELKALDIPSLKAFAEAKLKEIINDNKETESKETNSANKPESEKATEADKNTDFNNNVNNNVGSSQSSKKDSGCASSVCLSALAVIGIVGAVALVKKKED